MRLQQIGRIGFSVVALAFFNLNAFAIDPNWIEGKLREFNSNPEAFIKSRSSVTKYDPESLRPIPIAPKFSQQEIDSSDYVLAKDKFRQKFQKASQSGPFARIRRNDRAEDLVDDFKFDSLQEIETAKLLSSQISTSPWSGDYWPYYTLGIAKRYADPSFPSSKNWKTNQTYLQASTTSLERLSPAEKYDLLVGDSSKSMTRNMVGAGKPFFDRSGKVEDWMGYCHGWSPASFMLPRPSRVVNVMSADGRTQIPFYPDDIKALATALWANSSPDIRFISGRCDIKKPPVDGNGRILRQECFDTNPGTWHLAMINQLGVSKRSVIFDSAYDYEVWTQPAYSYEYTYFNPKTSKAADTLAGAIVKRSEFSNDKFQAFRSKDAAYLAGIVMKFVYVEETDPSHKTTNSPKDDKKVAVNYIYDIEMDKDKKVIGGEWYQLQHPDFMFLPPKNSRAASVGDEMLDEGDPDEPGWDGKTPISSSWAHAAGVASRQGQPLARIVEALIALSNLG